FKGKRQTLGVVANSLDDSRGKAYGRQHTGRISGVHAGLFDVFHDAADDDVGPVGERVDVYFGGFFKELVNQHWSGRTHQCGLGDVVLNGVRVVGDNHGPSAQYIAGTHEHRQTNFSREPCGLFRNQGRRVAWLRDFQLFEETAEAAAVFCQVDRFRGGTNDRNAVALQFQGKI